MGSEKKKPLSLTPAQASTLLNVVYEETAGGPPEEIAAATSAYLSRVQKQGFDKALLGSSAFKKRSPQYVKAATNQLNAYEMAKKLEYAKIVSGQINDPSTILPYTHHENIKAYGEPSWAKGVTNYKDIGRQRFYVIQDKVNPRLQALQKMRSEERRGRERVYVLV